MAGADETISKLRAALLKAKREHYYCIDSWYSCPKAPEGCSDSEKGAECDCGAEKFNAEIDAVLADTSEEDARAARIETAALAYVREELADDPRVAEEGAALHKLAKALGLK